jgi:hypothetical protein
VKNLLKSQEFYSLFLEYLEFFHQLSSIIFMGGLVVSVSIILGIISSFFGIGLGILGILFCKNLEKAKLLRYSVFAYIGFYFIYFIYVIINIINSNNILVIAGGLTRGIIGLVIPICFLLGVQKNIKAKGE